MATNLTKKEKDFAKEYVKTGNGVQSALKTYDTVSYKTASTIADANLDKPRVQDLIKSIAEQIPDSLLVEKHLELLNAEKITTTRVRGEIIDTEEVVDNHAISKGLDMAYKIKGTYAPEKSITANITINTLDPKSMEIAKKYEEEIKNQL